MSIENGGMPATIEPYLNPAYWNERFIGDGAAQPAPEREEAGLKDWLVGAAALALYARQGTSRLASSMLHPGDVFDASNYSPGTILLTLSEKLSRVPKAEDVVPMAEFRGIPVPDRLTGIVGGEQVLEGHGYRYMAEPLLNAVVGRKNERRVFVISDAVLGGMSGSSEKSYRRAVTENMMQGFTSFTVGDVYNFGSNDNPHDQTLARVTEAIVCVGGVRARGLNT